MVESEGLARRRCLNHPAREAAAICPQCRRSFCRECVVEHADRVLCAACLARPPAAESGRSGAVGAIGLLFRLLGGVLVTWFFFYLVGQALLAIPDPIHAPNAPLAGEEQADGAPGDGGPP